eukprot:15340437-Ditylum_brightwellii.AAC.1
MSCAMIPLLQDAFVTFCQEHDILLPFGNIDDGRSTTSDVSGLTNFSGVTLNNNKEKESDNNNNNESDQIDKNNERLSAQDQIDERSGGEDNNNQEQHNTNPEDDQASQGTMITGLKMEKNKNATGLLLVSQFKPTPHLVLMERSMPTAMTEEMETIILFYL